MLSLARNKFMTVVGRRSFLTVIPEYQRGVKLFLGKYSSVMQPGLRLQLPFIHTVHIIDTRDTTSDLGTQSLISADNVTFNVDATVQWRVADPHKAVLSVSNLEYNVREKSRMELRNTLCGRELNDTLHGRDVLSNAVLENLKNTADRWGIEFLSVQLRDIILDPSMTRAMATVAEAERNAEAKIINAQADVKTAKEYAEAAEIYKENPITLRLREFQLWQSVTKNKGTNTFVIPSNILDVVSKLGNKQN